ncbi:hypothetical protein SAMN02745116_00370 [Pilibacter termitis]|uniref:Uncharacterized protein n=1 Tax=Pilibacter termitis TaxID=263852 RepID=A0A1T4KT78_9ENTE|nr:hypothetical protein [Pilibacter termitis]SJZ45560.1 hypothetical protein SAMN02745116_00370 [Pilibacter termitis]
MDKLKKLQATATRLEKEIEKSKANLSKLQSGIKQKQDELLRVEGEIFATIRVESAMNREELVEYLQSETAEMHSTNEDTSEDRNEHELVETEVI